MTSEAAPVPRRKGGKWDTPDMIRPRPPPFLFQRMFVTATSAVLYYGTVCIEVPCPHVHTKAILLRECSRITWGGGVSVGFILCYR